MRPMSVVVKPRRAVGSGIGVLVGVGEALGDGLTAGEAELAVGVVELAGEPDADGDAPGLDVPPAVEVGPAEGEAVGEAVGEGVGVAGNGVGAGSDGPGVSSEPHV